MRVFFQVKNVYTKKKKIKHHCKTTRFAQNLRHTKQFLDSEQSKEFIGFTIKCYLFIFIVFVTHFRVEQALIS